MNARFKSVACGLAAVLLVVAGTAVASAHSFSAGRGFGGHVASIGRAFSGAGRSFGVARSAAPARFAPASHNFSQSGFSRFPGVTRPGTAVGARAFPGGVGAVGGRVGNWGGGYWHGNFWPRTYYRVGIPWFLPILPAAILTYWWAGLPYYYYDDAYYVWSSPDRGYVLTTPPPATDDDSQAAGGAVDDLYAYPKNGQSQEQQVQDRRDCEQWASSQGAGADYRRAIAACLEGRNYSVR
jgi:hypothetical protein